MVWTREVESTSGNDWEGYGMKDIPSERCEDQAWEDMKKTEMGGNYRELMSTRGKWNAVVHMIKDIKCYK